MILDKLLEQILLFFYSITDNYGLSIILLSLTVNIMMLPLFWIAEKLQIKERTRKDQMKDALEKVRNLKNKQEKYFYTREIYKQNNYSPYYSLVGLLGLIIQIPFFLAAYMMLEDFDALSRIAWGPINDLYRPDGLILIRGQLINALPFLMTFTNLFSVYLYTKNKDNNEKIQLITIAIIFFALLYKLSAALVLYWTMNNLFAIGKNWLLKKRNIEQEIVITNNYGLRRSVLEFITKHNREIVAIIALWSIYLLCVSIIYSANLPNCFTSTISLFFVIVLLDILTLNTLSHSWSQSKESRVFTIIAVFIVLLSHSIIILAKMSSIAAYDVFKYIIMLQSAYLVGYLLFYRKALKNDATHKTESIQRQDLYIPLLLAFPLIVYFFNNLEYFLDFKSLISYFALLLSIPLLVILFLRIVLKRLITSHLIFINIIAISFSFYSLPIITSIFSQTAETNILIHISYLALITLTLFFLYFRLKKVLVTLSIVLCSVAIVNGIFNQEEEKIIDDYSQNHHPSALELSLSNDTMKSKPDIYLLIYDAYTNLNQMKYYGIDNKPQEQFLKDQGFTVYDDIYTQWAGSLGSMSRVLDMKENNNASLKSFRKAIGSSTANSILQHNGYKTHYLLSSYFYSGSPSFSGDYRLIDIAKDFQWKIILKSILIGEFKFDMDFKVNDLNDIEYYNDKLRIINNNSDSPKFLYSHIHNPGHSQNSGKCIPDDLTNYHKNVASANQEMREDVEAILSMNRDAIIILAGDHGPFLTGDCFLLKGYNEKDITSVDLADRFGVFLAIKYPEDFKVEKSDINILQDVFFSVFANLYKNNEILDYSPKHMTYNLGEAIPKNAVVDGIIQYGIDKGKPLYWAMRDNESAK